MNKDIPTSIKIGTLTDKKSLKSQLLKKAIKLKKPNLHAHIVEVLKTHGV